MNVSAFPFGTWHIKNCLNLLMHQFRYGASSFGLEERSSVSVFLLCILDMSSSSLSSPLNIAWANRTMDGWNCICGERLSVLAGPDTQQFAAHCRGRKHRAGTPPLKPKRQLAVTQFFSAAPPPVAEEVPPPIESDGEDEVAASDPETQGAAPPPTINDKCMGALPLGIPNANALRGKYPMMRHAYEKVH